MKNFIYLPTLICIFTFNYSIYSQDLASLSDDNIESNLHSIYDYDELNLSSVDTIPDYQSKEQKLKLTGTIYKSDGVTPAKDVILYIEQADEDGDFDLVKKDNIKYPHHRGWVKTDANGRYTFYTFVPGNDRRYNQLQQLFPSIKAPSKLEYNLEPFLFHEDPLLSKLCRKRIAKKGDPSRILKPTKKDNILVVEKNIVLLEDAVAAN